MLNAEKRESILALHRADCSTRSIARRMKVNRKTVAKVIEQVGAPDCARRSDRMEISEDLLRDLHVECRGWKQRMHEKLSEEHGVNISYPTLTRRCRELGLARDTHRSRRADHVETEPGEEMQHDTSPYTVLLGGQPTKVVASILYLRYSKMRYLKFYLRFRRYEMKCFLHEALLHFGCCARVCIIDNTNLARLRGTGYRATIHPEMDSFSRRYGFEFICHEIGHSDRKAGNERCFWTTETNFLPGRNFENLNDLNAQAFQWATVRLSGRPHAKTKAVPGELFEFERQHLLPVTADLPGPTRPLQRGIDPYGCIDIDTNSFWIPGDRRGGVKIIEHPDHYLIYRQDKLVVRYPKPPQDVRQERFTPDGVDTRPARRSKPRSTRLEEDELCAIGPEVAGYIDFILSEAKGLRAANLIRLVHGLSRKISKQLFRQTIGRAHHYHITDIEVIENIAHMLLGQEGKNLPRRDVDPNLEQRDSYCEGSTSPAPDLSVYDLEDNIPEEETSC